MCQKGKHWPTHKGSTITCVQTSKRSILQHVQDEAKLQREAAQVEATEQQLQQALTDLKQCQEDLATAAAATTEAAQREDSAALQIQILNSQLATQQAQSAAALQALQEQLENLKQQAQLAQRAEAQRLQHAVEADKQHAAELQAQDESHRRAEVERDQMQAQLRSACERLSTAQQAISNLEQQVAAAKQQQAAGLNELAAAQQQQAASSNDLQQAQRDLIGAKAELDLTKQQLQTSVARQQEAAVQAAKVVDLEKSLVEKLNELHALQQQLVEKGVQLQVCHALFDFLVTCAHAHSYWIVGVAFAYQHICRHVMHSSTICSHENMLKHALGMQTHTKTLERVCIPTCSASLRQAV